MMFSDMCFLLLLLLLTSVHGRVTGLDSNSKDDNNADKPHITVNVKNTGFTCFNASVNNLETDKRIDFTGNILCKPVTKVDNGTALILTPYIEEGRFEEARIASKVNAELFLKVKSYSGFLTVNKTCNSNLFFWYFPVQDKSVYETPWIVWLQGGPGASSLIGLFDELGPFRALNGGTLRKNLLSWHLNHSLVFIDNPVGSGYSFTNCFDGFAKDMETYSEHLYTAVRQLVQVFPELRTAPLFLAGESYAGKYVPSLGLKIHENKQEPGGDINLQGLMMGSAVVDITMVLNLSSQFYNLGLIDNHQMQLIQPLFNTFKTYVEQHESVKAKNIWPKLIYVLMTLTSQPHIYNFLRDDIMGKIGKYETLLSKTEYKRALHVGDIKYFSVNATVNKQLAQEFLTSAQPKVEVLLDHYKVLVYCGQLDLMVTCSASGENHKTWRWNHSEEFRTAVRAPFYYKNKVAGYHKSGGGLTEVVIRGSGHLTSMDASAQVQYMVTQWTHGKSLGPKENFLVAHEYIQALIKNYSLPNYNL